MSSRIFQSVIQQIKDNTDKIIGVVDEQSNVIACNDLSLIGHSLGLNINEAMSMTDVAVINGFTYHVIGSRIKIEYAVFIKGTDSNTESLANILAVTLGSIKEMNDEKNDKTNFVKNVMLENILPGDIYSKCREIHFTAEAPRVVVLIRLLDRTEIFAYDIIQSLFPEKNKDLCEV